MRRNKPKVASRPPPRSAPLPLSTTLAHERWRRQCACRSPRSSHAPPSHPRPPSKARSSRSAPSRPRLAPPPSRSPKPPPARARQPSRTRSRSSCAGPGRSTPPSSSPTSSGEGAYGCLRARGRVRGSSSCRSGREGQQQTCPRASGSRSSSSAASRGSGRSAGQGQPASPTTSSTEVRPVPPPAPAARSAHKADSRFPPAADAKSKHRPKPLAHSLSDDEVVEPPAPARQPTFAQRNNLPSRPAAAPTRDKLVVPTANPQNPWVGAAATSEPSPAPSARAAQSSTRAAAPDMPPSRSTSGEPKTKRRREDRDVRTTWGLSSVRPLPHPLLLVRALSDSCCVLVADDQLHLLRTRHVADPQERPGRQRHRHGRRRSPDLADEGREPRCVSSCSLIHAAEAYSDSGAPRRLGLHARLVRPDQRQPQL